MQHGGMVHHALQPQLFPPKHRQGMLQLHLCPEHLPSAGAAHGGRLQHDGNGESGLDPDEDLRGARAHRGGPAYTAVMTGIYNKVTELSLPNYIGARLQFPSNLHFPEWEALANTPEDSNLISFLQHGFPVGYDGPVPTPATHNHASAV